MIKARMLTAGAILVLGLGSSAMMDVAQAGGFNPMNMMNPSRWMGGNKDRGDDYGPGYGYGAPGYGYGAPGYGYGAPAYGVPGYGDPAYGGAGYGAPPYGGGVPGYGAPPGGAGMYGAPPRTYEQAGAADPRVQELEDRIRALEAERQQAPAPGQNTWDQGAGAQPPAGGYPQYSPH